MIASPSVPECLERAFRPTKRGILGLTEQLLDACIGCEMTFERIGSRCVCRWNEFGETKEAEVPLPPAAFRTILARIAVLCNENSPNSVTPYGGEGLLAVKGHALTIVRAAFVNTPDKQQLGLKSCCSGEMVRELTVLPNPTAAHHRDYTDMTVGGGG